LKEILCEKEEINEAQEMALKSGEKNNLI